MIRSPENLRPHSKTETEEQADDPDVSAADEPMIAQSGELSAEEFSGEKWKYTYLMIMFFVLEVLIFP